MRRWLIRVRFPADAIFKTIILNLFEWKKLSMPWPGFEPGLLRPQRRVLTTRRSRLRMSYGNPSSYWWSYDTKQSGKACQGSITYIAKQFSWCSGYHICLTHRRSPVRSRAKTEFFFFERFFSLVIKCFKISSIWYHFCTKLLKCINKQLTTTKRTE